jgi:hypothetical protein
MSPNLGRFMGSLTALLVLASMMPVFTEGLPKASYTKLIDIWLLFFLISTPINITIHIWGDFLWKGELERKRQEGSRPTTVKVGFHYCVPVHIGAYTRLYQVQQMYDNVEQVIHNGQKIYPLKEKEQQEAFEDKEEEEDEAKGPACCSCITAKNVNRSFIIFFPVAFIVFMGYMITAVMLYPAGMRVNGERVDL